MNVLYVVGTGSKWGDNELRYSLRSICKNAYGLNNVYIVGNVPPFVSPAVNALRCDDKCDIPAKNILAKIRAAVKTFADLGEEFLVSSDDHFYIKPVDFDAYPIHKRGNLPVERQGGSYKNMLADTRRLLKALRLPATDYCQHANSLVNRTVFRMLDAAWDLAETMEYGVEPLCVVQNAMAEWAGYQSVERKDCKVGDVKTRAELLEAIGDRDCFSIYDSAVEVVEPYLQEMFPEKCRFEL